MLIEQTSAIACVAPSKMELPLRPSIKLDLYSAVQHIGSSIGALRCFVISAHRALPERTSLDGSR